MTSRPILLQPRDISHYQFWKFAMLLFWQEKIRRVLAASAEVPSLVEAAQQA